VKSLSGLWQPFLLIAVVGTLILFGLSYFMEVSLTQQYVADSTELLKHPRYLKSIALANLLFAALCFISSVFLPKKLLNVSAFIYAPVLYACYSVTNVVFWLALTTMHFIDPKDPFYYYFPDGLEPMAVIVGLLVLAVASSSAVFWFRKEVLKQVP
jgi:hypothetical protein